MSSITVGAMVQANISGSVDYRINKVYKNFNLDGLSYKNDYIPYYSLWENQGVYTKGNRKIIHYSLPDLSLDNTLYQRDPVISYPMLLRSLESSRYPRRFQTRAMEYSLYGWKGCLFDIIEGQPRILMLLTIKSSYIGVMDKTNIDYTKLRMYVSRSFATEAVYKTPYSKIKTEVLDFMHSKDIDVVFTNSIESKVFVNDLEAPKFKSITGMKEFFKEVEELILTEDE